jgi:hypothetical protein
MALKCPACDEAVKRTDVECPSCGTELNPVAPPPKAPVSDSSKYLIIVGVLVVAAAILIFVASGMQGGPCAACKGKRYTVCVNCKDGVKKCAGCKGTGFDQQTQGTCLTCSGSGRRDVCPKCNDNPKRQCLTCDGTGTTK